MKKLLFILIHLTFVLILWGATVRVTGAGLACPDWPLCHGKFIPPLSPLVILEWGHRLLASLVSLFTLWVALLAWKKSYRSLIGLQGGLLLFLLLIQVGLGALTVRTLLGPALVTTHLGVALLFFITQLWMLLRLKHFLKEQKKESSSPLAGEGKQWVKRLSRFSVEVTVLIYLQILLGGWVASSHAGLACADFPTCNGFWIPPLVGLVKFQFLHRLTAVLIVFVVLALAIFTWSSSLAKSFKVLATVVLGLTVLQFLLGVGNVLFGLPMAMRIAHLGVATAIFALLFIFSFRVRRACLL